METDKQLYKLFTAAPAQLYLLLGLPAPSAVRARAETFKDVQTESVLVLEPAEEAEPARLTDFQAYRDKRFVPKVMLRSVSPAASGAADSRPHHLPGLRTTSARFYRGQ